METDTQIALFKKRLENFYDESDQVTINSLEFIKEIFIARHFQTKKKIETDIRLKSDQDRFKRLTLSLKQNLDAINNLQNNVEELNARLPEVNENETLVQGRITDEKGRGISDAKISIKSTTGAKPQLVDILTDEFGNFSSTIDSSILETMEGQEFTFSVTRENGEEIYAHKEPFKVPAGDHQRIRTIVERKKVFPWLRRIRT